MALYQNGTLISGANTLPQMTLAEYQALPVSDRPTYWERTDLNYNNIPASDVTYGSGSVEDALDELNRGSASVTANGVKTLSTLLDELFALVDMSKVGIYTKLLFPDTAAIHTVFSVVQFTSSDIVLTAPYAWASANESVLRTFNMKSSGSQYYWSRTNGTIGNGSSNVVDNGLIITLYY